MKIDKYLDIARELKKNMEHEGDGDTKCNWRARQPLERIGTWAVGLGNKRTSGDHPVYSSIEIGQNTDKNPGDLKRLAVTQTPVKNNYQILMSKIIIIIIIIGEEKDWLQPPEKILTTRGPTERQ